VRETMSTPEPRQRPALTQCRSSKDFFRGVSRGHGESRDKPRKHHLWACPVSQAVVGQVEPKLEVAITGANLWLAQAPGQTCVSDVIYGSNRRHGNGKALYGSDAAVGGQPGIV
jgi:hypothetical protein